MEASRSISTPPARGSTIGMSGTMDSTASFSTAASWPGSTGVGLDIGNSSDSQAIRRPFYRLPRPMTGRKAFRAAEADGRSVLFGRLEAGLAQGVEHVAQVRPAARLQDQFDLHVLRRQQGEGALVVHLLDVSARFG